MAACGGQAPPLPQVSVADFPPAAQPEARQNKATLENDPKNPNANARLGMLFHAYERYPEALACYRRAVEFGPNDPRFPYLEGAALMANGDANGAAAAFERALSFAPHAPAFIRLGQALAAAGRTEDSRKAFEDALQLDPNAPAALLGLARIVAAEGESAEAIALLEKAVRLAPDSGAVHYALGSAQRDAGEEKASRHSFGMAERFQRSQPVIDDPILDQVYGLRRDPAWLVLEGRKQEAQGDVEQAVKFYQEAVDQSPDFAPAHVSLVSTLGLLGRFADAEKHYHWALQVAPGLEELHYNWGIVLAEHGDPEAAAQSFRAALQINPSSADSHFNLGSMLAQMGQETEAVRELQTAVDLNPGHRLALFQLAQRHIRAGRSDQAIPMLVRALDAPVDARTAGVLYALADAYVRNEDAANAVAYLRQALEVAVEFGNQPMADAIAQDLRGMTGGP
ncbi:MAG: tetratricopeptide repeat protein [Bryobacterales bacterium]